MIVGRVEQAQSFCQKNGRYILHSLVRQVSNQDIYRPPSTLSLLFFLFSFGLFSFSFLFWCYYIQSKLILSNSKVQELEQIKYIIIYFLFCWCKHLLVIWFTCMVNMVDIGKYWKIINEMTNEVWRISNLCFFQFYIKRALIGFATEDTEASYIRCISTKSDPLLRSIW